MKLQSFMRVFAMAMFVMSGFMANLAQADTSSSSPSSAPTESVSVTKDYLAAFHHEGNTSNRAIIAAGLSDLKSPLVHLMSSDGTDVKKAWMTDSKLVLEQKKKKKEKGSISLFSGTGSAPLPEIDVSDPKERTVVSPLGVVFVDPSKTGKAQLKAMVTPKALSLEDNATFFVKDKKLHANGLLILGAEAKTDMAAVTYHQLKEAINAAKGEDYSPQFQDIHNHFQTIDNHLGAEAAQIRDLNSRVNDFSKVSTGGVSQAMAAASLVEANERGESMLTVGVGTYRSAVGYALGFSHESDNGRYEFKLEGAGDDYGHYSAGAGLGLRL